MTIQCDNQNWNLEKRRISDAIEIIKININYNSSIPINLNATFKWETFSYLVSLIQRSTYIHYDKIKIKIPNECIEQN